MAAPADTVVLCTLIRGVTALAGELKSRPCVKPPGTLLLPEMHDPFAASEGDLQAVLVDEGGPRAIQVVQEYF